VNCVIIGGGLSGMLVARELAMAGVKVTVLERGATGREASWAGGGILSPLYPWRYPEAVNVLADHSAPLYRAWNKGWCHQGLPDPELLESGLLILDQAISWDDYAGNPIPYILRVAVDTSGLQAQQQDFQRTLWLWLGTLGILLLIVQLLAVRWGLRPLQQIAHHIQRIEQGHAASLPDDIPVETRPLATAVNSLIAQAHARQARVRHSLADLAHSLKTPLTILRGLVPEIGDSQQARLIEEQAVRIDEIVSYQRQKAAVSGAAPLLPPVAVLPVAERLGRGLQKLNADRRVDLHLDIPDTFALKMEPGDLMELLGNLLENAFRHARREVRIAGNHGPVPILTIDDDGNGIATDISEQLLHRGIRADQRHPDQRRHRRLSATT